MMNRYFAKLMSAPKALSKYKHAWLVWRSGLFDENWYTARYPNVLEAKRRSRLPMGLPLRHFLTFGWVEGKSPGPQFDAQRYLLAHPDVALTGKNPLVHYIKYGHVEGRAKFPVIDRKPIAGVGEKPQRLVPSSIVDKVLAQARHDPALFAPGGRVLGKLKVIDSGDYYERCGVDAPYIRGSFSEKPDTVILVSHLLVGGAEKYAADLADALVRLLGHRVAVIVTMPRASSLPDWFNYDILKPFKRTNVVFWTEVCGPAGGNPMFLARTLHALAPRNIVVVNSEIGLDMVERYGAGLSGDAKLFTTYFSLGLPLIVTTGDMYARRTLPYAAALTDNVRATMQMARWYGAPPERLVALPANVRVKSGPEFDARVERSIRSPGSRRRWLWVSRIERMKATHVLGELAALRPDDEFVVYGPLQDSLDALGILKDNISLGGVLRDVENSDFSTFDGYIFTSLFEGFPNVVLEVSQHGLPMVLSDVGGLRETFSADDVWYVDMAAERGIVAKRFSEALDEINEATVVDLQRRARSSYRKVAARHGYEAFGCNVSQAFGPTDG